MDQLVPAGLPLGDLATWASAIATFLAVTVAILLPMHQLKSYQKQQDLEHKRYAQILALEYAEVLTHLWLSIQKARTDLRRALPNIGRGFTKAQLDNFTLHEVGLLPAGTTLNLLPYPIGQNLVAVKTMCAMYNSTLQMLDQPSYQIRQHMPQQINIQRLLDDAQAALVRAVKYLEPYDPNLREVEFALKGDGSSIAAAPDLRGPDLSGNSSKLKSLYLSLAPYMRRIGGMFGGNKK